MHLKLQKVDGKYSLDLQLRCWLHFVIFKGNQTITIQNLLFIQGFHFLLITMKSYLFSWHGLQDLGSCVLCLQDSFDYGILGAASKLAAVLSTYPFQVGSICGLIICISEYY